MRGIWIFGLALSLSSCGSLAPDTDVPQGVYLGIGDRPDLVDDASVKIVEGQPPKSGGRPVTGTSCQNKLWEAAPTRERAIAVMKRQAKAAGMNAIYAVSTRADPNSISKNCWAAIIATGTASRM
jgi:hypothetical protein